MRHVEDPALRARYRREVRRADRGRGSDPGFMLGYIVRCAMHYHHQKLAREMAGQGGQVVNAF